MLRSRSATNSTAWLRRTGLTVMALLFLRGGAMVGGGSGDEPEAAGPGDLLGGGEGDLEEADGLELTGAAQRAGVDRLEAARGDDAGEGGLGIGVVTGDENGRREVADRAGGQ